MNLYIKIIRSGYCKGGKVTREVRPFFIAGLTVLSTFIFFLLLTGFLNNFGEPYIAWDRSGDDEIVIYRWAWVFGDDFIYRRSFKLGENHVRESMGYFKGKDSKNHHYYSRPLRGVVDYSDTGNITISTINREASEPKKEILLEVNKKFDEIKRKYHIDELVGNAFPRVIPVQERTKI